MPRGAAFEATSLKYLNWLFREIGFTVTEARKQTAGTQNGFDIRIGFYDASGRQRHFYFECKDYTTTISWSEIIAKVAQLDASGHVPDGYIALSPHVDFTNIQANVLEQQEQRVGFPIRYWTPSTFIAEYFALHPVCFGEVYDGLPPVVDAAALKTTLAGIVNAMLHQRDHMPVRTKDLTSLLPRIHSDEVIGRESALTELHGLLFDHKKVVVVNGMGGIGKTTVAQAYLSRYYHKYRHMVWIAQSSGNLDSDLVATAGLIESLGIDTAGKDSKQLADAILRGMKGLADGPNLLIVDNASDGLAVMKAYLPGPPNWHVLATSRTSIEGFEPKELDFLLPEDAVALFRRHCTRITDDGEILALVKSVDYHTLVIELLAKIAQQQRRTAAELRDALRDDMRANVTLPHAGAEKKVAQARSYLVSIFNLGHITEQEAWMMKQFACLPAEFIAYKLLEAVIAPEGQHRETFAETLHQLVANGWLIYNKDTDAYKMHLVVHEVVRQQLPPAVDAVGGLLHGITARLLIDQAKDNPVDKFQWVPYGKALLAALGEAPDSSIAELKNNMAMVLYALGDHVSARALLEQAVAADERSFGPDHPTTAIRYSNLAVVLQHLGDYARARALLEKAVASAERNFGTDYPTTATRYSNLAMVLRDLGNYADARALLERAVASDERNFGAGHPITTVSYSNLALVLQDLGSYAGAKALLEKAVASHEHNFGADHPNTSNSYLNLALVLKKLGDYVGARNLLKKAVALNERHLGEGHPTTAVSYSNLAMVLQALGDHDQARALLEKAVVSNERNYDQNHPTTAISYSNLALVLLDLGDYAQALVQAEKALAIFQKALPPGHPYIATAAGNLAAIAASMEGSER